MRLPSISALVLALASSVCGLGCSSGPPPQVPAVPPTNPPPEQETGFTRINAGSEDSTGAVPGSPGAIYRYRFRQIDPASERFTFRDRDVSFYLRPTPTALHIQIENLQDRPVWIEWERSSFSPPLGITGKLAHSNTLWKDRYATQAPTQIPGLQRYSDYLLPLDYLLDPAGSTDEQLHRPLFPEDSAAPQFTNIEFGIELVLRIEDRFRTYPFRFRVASVIPR